MKHVVEADPEVLEFVLFDPALVADEFSTANQQGNQKNVLKKLHADQKIVLIRPQEDSDPGSLMHAYVEEAVPDRFQSLIQTSISVEPFRVESGELHFTGAHCGPHPDEEDIPGHGESFPVPPGSYRLTINRMESTPELWHAEFAEKATTKQRLAYDHLGTVNIVAAIVILSCLISFFFLSWLAWIGVMILIAVPVFFVPVLYCKTRAFQEGLSLWEKAFKEHPDFVAAFERLPD